MPRRLCELDPFTDGAGNLTELTYPGSPARTVTYTYDNADRLATVTDWASRVTRFRYDPATSRLSRIELPNGTQRVFTYDSAGRVASVRDEVAAGGALVSQFTLGYDALDRIVEETTLPEPAQFAVTAASMTYDDDDRLTGWNALATFAYDARNRLTSVGNSSYTYDAENRCITRTVAGVATTFVHDPNAALSRLLQSSTGGTATRYVYAGSLLLYAETGSALRVHHYDYRGSTVALTDATGAVLGRVTYGSYGEIVARTGNTATEFLYNGRDGVVTDPNGLYHMRARYYSPETRRFLNADPIGFAGGINWYAYVNGSPVMFADPIGLCAQGREGFWSSIWNAYGDSQMMQAQYRMAQINHDVQIWGNRSEAFGLGGALALYGTGIGTVTEGYIGWSVGEGCDLNIWERGISIVGGELQGVSLYMGGRSLYSNFAAESRAATLIDDAARTPVGRSGNPMSVPGPQNVRTVINGREYSGHALDQMQGRGFVPSVVENTIKQGTTFPTRAGTTGVYDAVNNVRVITDTATGRVVTVIPGPP